MDNLDQEYPQKYENAIHKTEQNQISITPNLNLQISLKWSMILNKSISLVCHNQETIKLGMDTISNGLNKLIFDFHHYIVSRNVLDLINLTFEISMWIKNDIKISLL